MTATPRYPSLFQINTRVWLRAAVAQERGQPVTLADIDDGDDRWLRAPGLRLDLAAERLADRGRRPRRLARQPGMARRIQERPCPISTEDDICGSGFAITGYTAREELGGDAALAAFREKLARRGIRLMLDFVPNHTAIDHPWATAHPEYYVQGSEALAGRGAAKLHPGRDRARATHTGARPRSELSRMARYAAARLCQSRPAARQARRAPRGGRQMRRRALRHGDAAAARRLPAHLGRHARAVLADRDRAVRRAHPGFTFMAEVYWDLEWTLQQQGFDYCYDKRLYDRLQAGNAAADARPLECRPRLPGQARALPREPRRAAGGVDLPLAAAPGGRGDHLPLAGPAFLPARPSRGSARAGADASLPRTGRARRRGNFRLSTQRLLLVLRETDAFRDGDWTQLHPTPAWPGNGSSDGFVAYAWAGKHGVSHIVVVNYAPTRGQCHLVLPPFPELRGRRFRLTDRIDDEIYLRDGNDLTGGGLYIDQPAWGLNVFEVLSVGDTPPA